MTFPAPVEGSEQQAVAQQQTPSSGANLPCPSVSARLRPRPFGPEVTTAVLLLVMSANHFGGVFKATVPGHDVEAVVHVGLHDLDLVACMLKHRFSDQVVGAPTGERVNGERCHRADNEQTQGQNPLDERIQEGSMPRTTGRCRGLQNRCLT